MGVPSLFKNIVDTFPGTLSNENKEPCHILCFDFNCLIHHSKNNMETFLNGKNTPIRNQEEIIIIEVIRYMIYIIEKVSPNIVYISMDGVVPAGKMKQQKSRRYKKFYDSEKNKQSSSFDSNKISPGTNFMSKLSGRIKNIMTVGLMQNKKYKIHFSDINVPGEGEAKIMKYLNTIQNPQNVVIYGLDADLIVLTMLQESHKIKLMREGVDNEFDFLNINLLKKNILNQYNISVSKDPNQFFMEFALITSLGGNDFVDPLPHCKIKFNGLDKLMNAYKQVCNTESLITKYDNQVNIHWNILFEIFKVLQPYEDKDLQKIYSKMSNNHSYDVSYEHTNYCNKNHPFYDNYKHIFESIQFHNPYSWWNQQFPSQDMKSVIKDYLKSLQWNIHYYIFNEPLSWHWYYTHENAPLLKDIVSFPISNAPSFTKDNTKPFFPLEQLFYIMPPQSASILPKNYQQYILENIDSYPRKVKLNVLKGIKNIYCDVLFHTPLLKNRKDIINILNKTEISQYEANRNIFRDNPFFKIG